MSDDLKSVGMRAVPDSNAPDDSAVGIARSSLNDAEVEAAQARAGLNDAISDYHPPDQPNVQPPGDPPRDHFQDIVGQGPILMAMAAIGGSFGKAHGMAMLKTTNAMLKGMVQGSAEQYADARKEYDRKYEEFQDKLRTWNDTYKAYMAAYKGRIDAQMKAVQGANQAVGLAGRTLAMTESQTKQMQQLANQTRDTDSKIRARTAKEETDRIRAESEKQRAKTAQQNADLRYAELKTKLQTADSNQITSTIRGLQTEYNEILKQYPPGKVEMPPEAEAKLAGLRKSMDLANQKLQDHTQENFEKNKATYQQAADAIRAGADPVAVKKRLAENNLNPDQLDDLLKSK